MAGRGASRLRRARGPRGHARCAAEGGCRLASRDSSADAITRAKSGSTRNPACRSVSAFRTLPRLMPSRPGRFGIAAPLVLACGVLAAAEEVAISEDGLTYTFHLRPALQYMDGTRCASGDFRACLEAGLRRSDCGIQAWALAAVRGVDRVRPGQHFLPPLGIDTPDDRTLVLHLARGDSLLLRRLALPGVTP